MENVLDSALEDNMSKASTKATKADIKPVDQYLEEIKGFEEDRVLLAKGSAKTAWKVATGFGGLAFLAVGAVVAMMPLKTIDLRVLQVDSATGHTTEIRPMSDAKGITYGEILDRYWLNQFVLNRNGYKWETIQKGFNTVKIMSNSEVFGAYSNYIMGKKSPTKIYADTKVIRVTVDGITILPETSKDEVLAQVRFTRYIENNEGVASLGYEPTKWTATITFDYHAEIKTMDERQLNPLGFQVTSYGEDKDINQ